MIRLGLADDEPLHIMGLATLLGAQPDMEIIWRPPTARKRSRATPPTRPMSSSSTCRCRA